MKICSYLCIPSFRCWINLLRQFLFNVFRDNSYLCTMRLGKNARFDQLDNFPAPSVQPSDSMTTHASFHSTSSSGSSQSSTKTLLRPSYCESFSTDGGTCTRNLKLVTKLYFILTNFWLRCCADVNAFVYFKLFEI